jgi:hypothetical protein
MNRHVERLLLGLALALGSGAFAGACSDPPIKNIIAPLGVMRGQFLYTGPPPCTEKGRVVGAAIILVFDQRLLPPPEGLAGRSYRIKVIPGDQLFAEAAKTLAYNDDGSRTCAPQNAVPIFASAPWDLSPFEAGNYQIRAFYDLDGDFHPAFRFSNLPTKGDITGGTIANIPEALAGKPPVFTTIPVGTPDSNGNLAIPELGVLIDNLSVTVALPAAFQRPYFHVETAYPGSKIAVATPGEVALDRRESNPTRVTMPADFHLVTASPLSVLSYLYVLDLKAGVLDSEKQSALASPFFMHIDNPESKPIPTLRWDSNRDGTVGNDPDRVVGSETNAPSLAPIVSLQKLDRTDPIRRNPQTPRILNSAITFESTLSGLLERVSAGPPVYRNNVLAAIRPTAVCIADPADKNSPTIIVTPFEKDSSERAPIISNPQLLTGDVAALLGRAAPKFEIVYACLPPGDFSINVINLGGQAWTLPNEGGVCMPGEPDMGNGMCGKRPRLPSQDAVFAFGPADDPAGCISRFQALADAQKNAYRANCLTPDEQRKLDNGTLWNAQ